MTIDILPDGTVRTLYTETIPLHELGSLSVERASNVEFDAASQQWTVAVGGRHLFSHASRSECLQWEHAHQEEILDAATAAARGDRA